MENSKLVTMLAAFEKKELNEFSRFINSDFVTRNPVVRKLNGRLTDHLKGKKANLDRKALDLYLYPDKQSALSKLALKARGKAIRKRTDQAFYLLKSLLEDFLVYKEAKEPGGERDILLLNSLQKHGMDQAFFDLAHRRMDPDPIDHPDMRHHLNQHRLALIVYEHPGNQRMGKEQEMIGYINDHLITYYILRMLNHIWIQQLARMLYNDEQEDIPMVDEVLELGQRSPYCNNVLVKNFVVLIQDLRNDDLQADRIEDLLQNLLPYMEEVQKHEDFAAAFNLVLTYAVCLSRFKQLDVNLKIVDLYRYGASKNLLHNDGKISFANFYNGIGFAINAGRVDLGWEWFRTHCAALPESIRSSTIELCRTMLLIADNEPRAAWKVLQEGFEQSSPFHKLIYRCLKLQALYLMGDPDLFEHGVDAARKHYERHQASSDRSLEQYRAFVRLLRKLYHSSYEKGVLEEMLKDLTESRVCAQQDWLTEQVRLALERYHHVDFG